MSLFRAPPHLPKISHTYPTMKKLGTVVPYLKKIQNIYESCDTPIGLWWHQHFFTGNQQILQYQEIQIYIALLYIFSSSFNFCWFFLIIMVAILMMLAKIASLGLLKIKVFRSKVYGVTISVKTSRTKFYHVNQIIS